MRKLSYLLPVFLLLTGCSVTDYESYSEIVVGNPYDAGSGHYAGYEWAERTGRNCNGNSQSFNEGCEEYYYQTEN